MRTQPGTISPRLLFYFDEVFGYFPPYPGSPPSKYSLLTLMKQARAFGLSMILATQNPVDIDYKGLTNAGTWFLGKLQQERDKERVLSGLEGTLQESGKSLDKSYFDSILSSLKPRTFFAPQRSHKSAKGNNITLGNELPEGTPYKKSNSTSNGSSESIKAS